VNLPITDEAEAWTVQLKSAETGFTNDDAASWRITVVPDLPPEGRVVGQPIQGLPQFRLGPVK